MIYAVTYTDNFFQSTQPEWAATFVEVFFLQDVLGFQST